MTRQTRKALLLAPVWVLLIPLLWAGYVVEMLADRVMDWCEK